MRIEGKNYKTIWFDQNSKNVKIIDQTKLPHEFIIKDLETVDDAINAIKVMEVRGAPLIGATAAFGIVLAIKENNDLNFIKKSAEDLVKARPTAINLQWAVHRMNNKISMIKSENLFDTANIFGFLAIILAAVNIFGGFLVTQRMLSMYKKKKKDKK